MFRTRMLSALGALLCLLTAAVPALAVETDCDSTYCFSANDFSEKDTLRGICLTDLPTAQIGSIMLGERVLRPGDILTADQIARMTFSPLRTETDRTAEVGYLPIYANAVAGEASMTISVRGKEDKAPVAEDCAFETYKNLPTTGKLKVSDPEGAAMTFNITRQPKRGALEIQNDGSFTYTPKKNKVGVDSFTFTASDPAGKVSREATVTITILKPTSATQYTDTVGKECRFAAEWAKNTGIFVGESLAGNACFSPDRAVTRGEFAVMLAKALELKPEEDLPTGYTDEIPGWLKPYLAAAVRSGLTAGLPQQEVFEANTPISGAEAAVMLQNALDLTVKQQDSETAVNEESTVPVWAETALTALSDHGMEVDALSALTRGDAAQLLYQVVRMRNYPSYTE